MFKRIVFTYVWLGSFLASSAALADCPGADCPPEPVIASSPVSHTIEQGSSDKCQGKDCPPIVKEQVSASCVGKDCPQTDVKSKKSVEIIDTPNK